MDYRYILNVDLIKFMDGLYIGMRERRKSNLFPKFWLEEFENSECHEDKEACREIRSWVSDL